MRSVRCELNQANTELKLNYNIDQAKDELKLNYKPECFGAVYDQDIIIVRSKTTPKYGYEQNRDLKRQPKGGYDHYEQPKGGYDRR